MVKVFVLLFLALILLVSGCTTETGKVVETTKLTISDSPDEIPESIEDVRREFEEFEKSHTANLSEQNESHGALAENPEETESTAESEANPEEETITQNQSVQKQCPSCDDNNPCTKDSCSEQTDFECAHEAIIPCCGNSQCEEGENWSVCQEDCECDLNCEPCENPDSESCSCLPKTECVPDGCCPGNCTYISDSDCPKPSVVFSEIQYNVPGDDSDHEWFEVYNNGTLAIDLTKWVFEETSPNHAIKNTTSETNIPAGSYAVIAENTTQFLEDYPGYSGLLFDSSWGVLSQGELLILRMGKNGEISDSVFYNSTWGGDGTGFSLEKIDLNGPNIPENWNQSIVEKGTPGQKNSISP